MGRDADNPQISALCCALGIKCMIYNLDASATNGNECNSFEIGPMTEIPVDEKELPIINLLYRPGHYDLLEY